MKLKTNLVAFGLVATTLLSTSACHQKDDVKQKVLGIEDAVNESLTDSQSTEVNVLEILNNSLYDKDIDYNTIINKYLNSDYETRLSLKDDYLRAIYMLLLNSGVDMNTYLEELNNLCVVGVVPTDIPNDIWYELFGNLINVSNNYSSLYDMFNEFAQFVHELNCSLEHTVNSYGSYSCQNLEDEYKLMR